jgi:hypothetical protein
MAVRIMAVYTFEISAEHNYPNIAVYRKLEDGVLCAWRVNANEGYVMYDPNANDMELDPITMMPKPVTYYYTIKALPLNFNFANFPWVAVPRYSVDENYIFGGGNGSVTI